MRKFSIWLENKEEAGFEADIFSDHNPPPHKFLIYADWLEDHERENEANFIRNIVNAIDKLGTNEIKPAALYLSEAKKHEKLKNVHIHQCLQDLCRYTIGLHVEAFLNNINSVACRNNNDNSIQDCPICHALENRYENSKTLADRLRNDVQPYMLSIRNLRRSVPDLRNFIDLLQSCPF